MGRKAFTETSILWRRWSERIGRIGEEIKKIRCFIFVFFFFSWKFHGKSIGKARVLLRSTTCDWRRSIFVIRRNVYILMVLLDGLCAMYRCYVPAYRLTHSPVCPTVSKTHTLNNVTLGSVAHCDYNECTNERMNEHVANNHKSIFGFHLLCCCGWCFWCCWCCVAQHSHIQCLVKPNMDVCHTNFGFCLVRQLYFRLNMIMNYILFDMTTVTVFSCESPQWTSAPWADDSDEWNRR